MFYGGFLHFEEIEAFFCDKIEEYSRKKYSKPAQNSFKVYEVSGHVSSLNLFSKFVEYRRSRELRQQLKSNFSRHRPGCIAVVILRH